MAIRARTDISEAATQTEESQKVTRGSGNVFADLGLPNPEELLQKSKLVVAISDAIKDRGMSQIEASKLIGVSQPDLSKLLRGRTMSFTLDRLVAILNHLGKDVDLIVSSHPGDADVQGEFRVLQVVG